MIMNIITTTMIRKSMSTTTTMITRNTSIITIMTMKDIEHHHDHDHEGHDHHHDHDHECGCGCGHDHHHDHHGHHHADEVFTSWGHETMKKYTQGKQVAEILKTLESDPAYGDVLRAKGMVESPDGTWVYFDMVPGEHEVRSGAPEYTGRLCVIGAKLDEEKLEELFGLHE